MTTTFQLPTFNTELPCSGSLLPTKAEYVQFYNDIAAIPSQLKVYLSQTPDIDLDYKKQLEDIIEQIEEFFELQSEILSPWWTKGQIRDWQKEANDAWTQLIAEFHMYVPIKMMELISKIIPVNFNISIMGLSIDLLRILEKEEQERIKKQITDEIDRFYNLIPEAYQYYKGEFGIICDEWKGKLTWDYIKSEIVKACTNLLHSLFGKLIDKFKDIWDALGLPSLPALLEFDLEVWIREQIDTLKKQAKDYIKDLQKQLETLKNDVKTLVGDLKKEAQDKIDQLKDDIQNFSVNSFIIEMLKEIQLFGVSLLDLLGGEIKTTVIVGEVQIEDLVRAARDWFTQWQKELINQWIKKIKSFLDAIGLGALMDLLTLTFCDFLKLIGVPMSIDLQLPKLPEIPNGV